MRIESNTFAPMQGNKTKRTSLIGSIGSGGADKAPSTPPAHIRTHKPRSPSTASIHSEEGECMDGPEFCPMFGQPASVSTPDGHSDTGGVDSS